MNEATAKLSNYRQAPRKVRLVADLVRGKRVHDALAALAFLPKRASEPMAKLIRSAAANALTKGLPEQELVISHIAVGEGLTFRRFMPRARGRASAIRKKTSNIVIGISARAVKGAKAKAAKAAKEN